MNTKFRDYIIGVAVLVTFTLILYGIGYWISPNFHNSLLESFGTVMILMLGYVGIREYKSKEHLEQ